MDSLTQMALGASVGYAVAGKQWGLKAMLWGAVGGSIPDFDVFANFWLDELEGLAFHRGFTHSLLFIFGAPFLMIPLFRTYYIYEWDKWWLSRSLKSLLLILAVLIGFLYSGGVGFILLGRIGAIISLVLGAGILIYTGMHWRRFYQSEEYFKREKTTFGSLYLFFLLSFGTHVFIDVCTTYGTQIFYPFSLFRVSFNNISIIDPMYTLPLLLGLVAQVIGYRYANTVGIILSSLYLLATFWNHQQVSRFFSEGFHQKGYEVDRMIVTPGPAANVFWKAVGETDDKFVVGTYHSSYRSFIEWLVLDKPTAEIPAEVMASGGDRLLWFSNGYSIVHEKADTSYIFQDLRFAFPSNGKIETNFGYELRQTKDGWRAIEYRDSVNMNAMMKDFRRLIWHGGN